MAEIHSLIKDLPYIPTNLSIPQFIFDHEHTVKPARNPATPWLIEDGSGRGIGENELRSRTFGLANTLASRYKIREDDVVLIFSRNHIDYPVAIWATHRIGGVISGANPDFSRDELVYQLELTNATFIIAHPDSSEITYTAAKLVNIPKDRIVFFNTASIPAELPTIDSLISHGLKIPQSFVEPQIDARTKLAFLCCSSGTTGRPKAVAIPHYALITNVIQYAVHNKVNCDYAPWEQQRYRSGDIAIGVLPLYHIYGLLLNLHFILFSAMSLVVVPKFNFIDMLKSIELQRITHLMLVPPQIVLLCKHPAVRDYDLSSIRCISTGAAPLSRELHEQLVHLLPNAQFGQTYGMTETCTAVSVWPVSQKRGLPGSAGQLMPGVIARVVKRDGSLATFNEPGELVVYTPSAALNYLNNEIATKETFVSPGWIRTGDEVMIDENTELWVLDRLKEIMKVRGFQVAPAELEGCILGHPDVSDACVVGVPDDYSGEVPLAFVVLSNDAVKRVQSDPRSAGSIKNSIMNHVKVNKVNYKHLKDVEFVDAIPKNPSGKLLRRVLRERAKEMKINVKVKL